MSDKATERPWTKDKDKNLFIRNSDGTKIIADFYRGDYSWEVCHAHIDLILKAVNLHDELVEALEEIIIVTKDAAMFTQAVRAREIAQKALAKTKETDNG
jgi:hypothetical protein